MPGTAPGRKTKPLKPTTGSRPVIKGQQAPWDIRHGKPLDRKKTLSIYKNDNAMTRSMHDMHQKAIDTQNLGKPKPKAKTAKKR